MPILLTTPADGGVIVDGATYTHAKIAVMTHNALNSNLQLEIRFGNMVGEEIEFAPKSIMKPVAIYGQDYIDLVTEVSLGDELVYDGVKRVLYQWLIDNGHLSGTII